MKRALLALAAIAILPLSATAVDAQNTCVTTSWVDTGPVRNVVRPGVDEYRGRVTFTRQAGCPLAGCPDGTAADATFRLGNGQQPWVVGNFTQNPVPVNGSTQPLSVRTTQNELFFRLNRSAPAESSFTIQVFVECGSPNTRSVATKSFRVGPLVDVAADVVAAAPIDNGAQWVIRITNSGNVPVIAEFEPHPSESEAGINWTVPDFQLVPVAEGDAESLAVAVTVLVQGENISGNLSLTLRMREADDEQAPPFEFELPLPYTVFTGKSTPTVPVAWLLIALIAVFVARRR